MDGVGKNDTLFQSSEDKAFLERNSYQGWSCEPRGKTWKGGRAALGPTRAFREMVFGRVAWWPRTKYVQVESFEYVRKEMMSPKEKEWVLY